MGRIIDRRRVMGGKSLPYDAEIEYLESTATSKQYVDTGIPTIWDGLVVTLDTSVSIGIGGEYDFFGQDSPNWNYAGYFSNLNNGFVLQIGTPYVIYGTNDGGRHIHIYNAVNKTCSFDNSTTPASNLTWIGTDTKTFKLFQRLSVDGTLQSPSDSKLYAARFVKDGVLVRDFIPVRVGQVGYMYDKVSGTLFGNAGTGDFILGHDKGAKNININVKTHSIGGSDASLDVITENRESVNILYRNVPWENGDIRVEYSAGSFSWQIYAITPCLYNGQVYNAGDLITNWEYTVTKDINIVADI